MELQGHGLLPLLRSKAGYSDNFCGENMDISLGKRRRLQQASSKRGTFTVLAADHRGPLRVALEEKTGKEPTDEDLSRLKQDMVRELASATTAVLLDPETGAGPCITSEALLGQTALLMAMDSGSSGDPALTENALVKGWSVEQSAAIGAAGVKLLVYYHPDSSRASRTETLIREVGEACKRVDLPFYLEPLTYVPASPGQRLRSSELRRVVCESARRLAPLGADILKAEFPLNVVERPDEAEWLEACQELTSNCPVPWVLLSAGVAYETFLRQTRIACQAGASGVMVGRAVWNEAVTMDVPKRNRFLKGPGLDRMRVLRDVCETGRSWRGL